MFKFINIIYIVLCINCVKAKTNKSVRAPYSDICDSDYREVVASKFFVDKTLLILDLFAGSYVHVVTAPSQYGKSTVVDMVKRFLDLQVTQHGNPIYVKKTENYKLFKDNRLEITKYKRFFWSHFGQYPVMLVNYKPLSVIANEKDMFVKLRTVIHNTFLPHKYIENSPSLWKNDDCGRDKFVFVRYVHNTHHLKLKPKEIANGFKYLSKLLFKHFKRKVVILVDGYDTYVQTLLFTKVDHMNHIITFISNLNQDLMEVNEYVCKVFITGVFRINGLGLISYMSNVTYERFLGDHLLSKYYGLDQNALDGLLNKCVIENVDKHHVLNVIDNNYNGFSIERQNAKMYNMWSVLKFFENNNTLDWYWCKMKHYRSLSNIFHIQEITEEINNILLGKTVPFDITEPINKETIYITKMMQKDSSVTMRFHIDCFLKILYNLGYFTGTVETRNGVPISKLKIPNNEILQHLTTFVREKYFDRFAYSVTDLYDLHEAIDRFRPSTVDYETLHHFHKSLTKLFKNSNHHPQNKNDIQCVLFAFMIHRFPLSKIQYSILTRPNNESVTNVIDLIIINNYRVAVVFEMTISHPDHLLDDLAIWCHDRVNAKYQEHIFGGIWVLAGKVIIGLSYEKKSKDICIASTYSFKYRHTVNHVTVIK